MPFEGRTSAVYWRGAGASQLDHTERERKESVKREILVSLAITLCSSLAAAEAGSKTELTSAAKKVEEAVNYSWKTMTEFGNFNGTTEGKAEKDGPLWFSMTFGDNTTEAVRKAGKWAVKTSDHDWQTLAELERPGSWALAMRVSIQP